MPDAKQPLTICQLSANPMNLSATIIPKSDQLNADDLMAGPRTIKITGVDVTDKPEQPVWIHYEGGKGRPYKPSKSMRRVLIVLWGSDSDAYIGRSLTLYRDPTVTFGSDAVGGIKISHMSDIPEAASISLTEKRGKRKPHRVEPLTVTSDAPTIAPPDIQTLTDIGDTKAQEGVDALRMWWANVPACPAKTEVGKSKLPGWKIQATAADQGRNSA